MQLNKIKLSGFKSFVDPTNVLLPSNLVAVVGPNGCGKSNIIDAITWVMGESSAKYLRGELLTDVIFNGSSARKPIGQASVELVFDNSDGSLGGEYSAYAEISIKRVITRNADSSYFLNGVRCRRKDVIDIFLGTGLGPRSYSIIGQNMISRIIEAKPDEMRVYLEEAAGISKYKERRRETENRIRHTKENLSRLDDVRLELEKQLSTLKRQANAAERYKTLKQEERVIKSQWHAAQWRQLDAKMVNYTLQIQQQETGIEARHTELSGIDRALETRREEQRLSTETLSEVQRRYYAAGNDITRMEQDIRHHQERQKEWQTDLQQVDHDWQYAIDQLQELEDQSRELTSDLADLEPEVQNAEKTLTLAKTDLVKAEEAAQIWQINWDEFNAFSAKTTQDAQVEQTRIQHLEQKLNTLKARQAKLSEEQQQFNFENLEKEIAELAHELQISLNDTEEKNRLVVQATEEISALQTKQKETSGELDQVRNTLQKLHGQLASLEALQQTALGQKNDAQVKWLAQHNLDNKMRLAQGVEVDKGWETAVEKVLGTYLQAVCVDDVNQIAEQASQFKDGKLAIFGTENAKSSQEASGSTLLSKIKSNWSLDSLLSGVLVADTLSEALAMLPNLSASQSVVTPDGTWLGAAWMQLSKEEDPAAGVFQREKELKELSNEISAREIEKNHLETSLNSITEELHAKEKERSVLQTEANQSHSKTAEVKAREKVKRESVNELKRRADLIVNELKENASQSQQTQDELSTARNNWQQAMQDLEVQAEKRNSLIVERDQTRDQLKIMRDSLNRAKDQLSESQIRLQTTQSQQASLQQTAAHMQSQLSTLAKRKKSLEEDLKTAVSIPDLEKTLKEALDHRLEIEGQLNTARSSMEVLEQDVKTLEANRQGLEREISKVRDILETLRLESQSIKVKSENILEQVKELGVELEEILQNLPEELSAEQLHSELEQIALRINRLGAINLVAIEEFATCSERKEYLDKQYADLQDGLNTLENAIAKIDKETRTKFRETFDKVNDRFQELFPAVFGGGRAYLELTGESILDSGISVMACPPGKRNSTIHLLSGGEKALTAIALVFSIFHLNPAPFCLLDEVDAPLDDANIVRFCNLVRNMSEKTQFIFISHNKLAIEMAKHLIGVTMHEPGVSRLVSVNVEEAITLANA